jgi:hypothetical protein
MARDQGNRARLTALAGGASNSRPSLTSETPGTAGLDTARLRFRADSTIQRELHERLPGEWQTQARGELRRTRAGVTVGTYPDGLVYVEGRVRSLVGDPDNAELAPAAALGEAGVMWRDTLGLDVEPEVGRADVTGELLFSDARDGLDFMAALRHVDVPWLKIGTEGWKRDQLETVYGRYVRGRSVQFRVYDAGVHHGTHGPGERVRFERQRRFRKDRARAVADFTAEGLASWFVGRELGKLIDQEGDVMVVNENGAQRELRKRAMAGELDGRTAERLAGYIALRGTGLPRATLYRRAAELRDLGMAVDRTARASKVVPVGSYVGRVVESFAA